jgi:hypothetical protein
VRPLDKYLAIEYNDYVDLDMNGHFASAKNLINNSSLFDNQNVDE